MPQVVRGLRSTSDIGTPGSPVHDRRVTFENGREESSNSLQHVGSPSSPRPESQRGSQSWRRRSSHRNHDREHEESDAYYDSRAATQKEFRRRASNLQSYYLEHPDLLPQLPFTFRHGFKRWKLGGYVGLMVFDACVVPILLYYSMTFGGNLQGWIVFAVITAIWGGPTYAEFALRSLRLIKNQRFYKPLGVDKRWAFDITNWILVLTIAVVTALLIVGAAPHDVFLRVLSMPGPAIVYCVAGPIFLLTFYNICGWNAPFRISSTHKGDKVLPGIYYIVEDIVAVNSGGGRPFREGIAARYKASPIFRKMIRDLSWFWSIPGLLVAAACTVVVVLNEVPEPVAYGIGMFSLSSEYSRKLIATSGWAVPFIWAGIWTALTIPWVRSSLHKEKISWEEETGFMTSTMLQAPNSSAGARDKEENKESEPSTSGDTAVDAETEEARTGVNVSHADTATEADNLVSHAPAGNIESEGLESRSVVR